MAPLIILATIMAIFGVLGYHRGTRSMLVTSFVLVVGLMAISRAGPQIARLINGLGFGVRFVLAGGLSALSAEDKGAAIDEVTARMGAVTPIVDPEGAGVGMLLVVLFGTLVAFGLGSLKFLRGKRSVIGLLIGVMLGYVLTAFMIRLVAPTAAVQLPLPVMLFGAAYAAPATTAVPTGPTWLEAFWAWLINTLNTWAQQGVLGIVFAILIAAFVLIATRLGNRSAKRG